jgi:protein-S-isoprenylcysteine O-methyltransferase Ste14
MEREVKHSGHGDGARRFLSFRANRVLCGFLAIGGDFLVTEHWAPGRTGANRAFSAFLVALYEAQRRHSLATAGVYAHVRHQQYAGSVLAMFPVPVFMYARLARIEERETRAEFGPAYDRYMQEAPAFIPRLGELLGGPKPGSAGQR